MSELEQYRYYVEHIDDTNTEANLDRRRRREAAVARSRRVAVNEVAEQRRALPPGRARDATDDRRRLPGMIRTIADRMQFLAVTQGRTSLELATLYGAIMNLQRMSAGVMAMIGRPYTQYLVPPAEASDAQLLDVATMIESVTESTAAMADAMHALSALAADHIRGAKEIGRLAGMASIPDPPTDVLRDAACNALASEVPEEIRRVTEEWNAALGV